MRWVVYVDMDAFYVSCELRDRPEDRGKPVIVGPSPKIERTRGVVLSASYEARRFGVHSAQPVGEADRRCPEAVWIPPDHAKYARISDEVRAWLSACFDPVVAHSIDEFAFHLDVNTAEEARARGEEFQRGLREELGLPSSIGIASHRILAKIASDRAKPGGIVLVPMDPESIQIFLGPLSVRAIPGVGPKTEERLRSLGIEHVEDLARHRRSELRAAVGEWAGELLALAAGRPRPDPVERDGPRSRSTDRTLPEDIDDPLEIEGIVRELSRSLASTLAQERLRYGRGGIGIKWADFTRVTRTHALPGRVEGPEPLEETAVRLVRELLADERLGRRRKVRLLSVRVERLAPALHHPSSLDRFDAEVPPQSNSARRPSD
ncbi:DNA-directed DNA polymerase [mine drainage metagenome]|uniref:DNA-directed DNA polymerase n=1 Tax=mine drainage metagenome TaxID=410659 RepID=T1B872_9ZZZZ